MKRSYCVDIDNVVAATDVMMRELIHHHTRGRVNLQYLDIKQFNYHECADCQGGGISIDDWREVHETFSRPANILRLEPIPGAIQAVRGLAQLGDVFFVTARLSEAREATLDWLSKVGLGGHEVVFCSKKHELERRFTAAVEDDYKQAAAFVQQARTPCYLIRHPWNASSMPLPGLTWVAGWEELLACERKQR